VPLFRRNWFYQIWLFSLLIKLVISAWMPLSSDESYYWVWSKHLQLSYYDHPPMIAYLINIGYKLFPFGQALRWPAVLISHCSWLFWYSLIKGRHPETFDSTKVKLWFSFLLLNPLLGWGGLLALPDAPLLFFWSAALYSAHQWLDKKTLLWAILLGTTLGLGFLSKYHIVLFVPCLLIWIIWDQRWHDIKWSQVPYIIFFGLLFCTPVLIWNYQNDFISFKFQLKHGLQENGYKFDWTLNYLLSQFLLLFPSVVFLLVKFKRSENLRWLWAFGTFPLFFFFLSSLKAPTEANWPLIGYPALLSLAVIGSNRITTMKFTIGVWLCGFLLVFSELLCPWIPISKNLLKTSELNRYDRWMDIEKKYQPFFASSFQMASDLSYKTNKRFFKLKGIGRFDFFDLQKEAIPPKTGFYLAATVWDSPNVQGYTVETIILLEDPLRLYHFVPIQGAH